VLPVRGFPHACYANLDNSTANMALMMNDALTKSLAEWNIAILTSSHQPSAIAHTDFEMRRKSNVVSQAKIRSDGLQCPQHASRAKMVAGLVSNYVFKILILHNFV
jgi:L-asparaginase II